MNSHWSPSFDRQDVRLLEEETLLSSFITVKRLRLQFRLFSGGWSQEIQRELICRPKAVGVLLYEPSQDEVLLIEQVRTGVQEPESPWLLEIVAGMLEPDELPERTAVREVMEEAGCEVVELLPICNYWVSAGISDERTQIYCGRVSAPLKSQIKGIDVEGEDIRGHVFSAKEAFSLLAAGNITSASTVIAIQWLQIHHEALRQRWIK